MTNTEIHHQRYRTYHIWQVSYQFGVTTMMTLVFNHLVGLGFVCCVKKVNKLIDQPVVILLGTREIFIVCLLLIDKGRAKDKTYI